MRFILALSVLITLCGSASAASVHHARRAHAMVYPDQGMIAPNPAPPRDALGYTPDERMRFLDSVRHGG